MKSRKSRKAESKAARITKAAIYASFGIEYRKGKIKAPETLESSREK